MYRQNVSRYVDQFPTSTWPFHRSTIGRHVDWCSVKSWSSVGQVSTGYRLSIGRVSTKYWSKLDRVSVNTWPTYRPTYWPTYQPRDRPGPNSSTHDLGWLHAIKCEICPEMQAMTKMANFTKFRNPNWSTRRACMSFCQNLMAKFRQIYHFRCCIHFWTCVKFHKCHNLKTLTLTLTKGVFAVK